MFHNLQVGIVVTIETGRGSFCGGSVLSTTAVLTAAHCVKRVDRIELIFGAQLIKENESNQQTRILPGTSAVLHESYSSLSSRADIALVLFHKDPLEFNDFVQPLRLPSVSDVGESFSGRHAMVSGWGKDSDDATSISPALKFVEVDVVPNFVCWRYYFPVLRTSNICTNGSSGRSTCNGDSGSPLVVTDKDGQRTLIGIVSFGSTFGCEKGFPSVYTRVTSFIDWISTKTGIPVRTDKWLFHFWS